MLRMISAQTIDVLHGFEAVAALKASTRPGFAPRGCVLHGFEAVAALKAERGGGVRRVFQVLHGFEAVAALKGVVPVDQGPDRGRSPRLRSRGRIEGTPTPSPSAGRCSFSTASKPWPH